MSASTPITTNSLALHDIVLSIADSLNEAQEQLRSMPPYDEYGRPNTLYQLPYLDFNLEVVSQFESTEAGNQGGGLPQVRASNVLRFTPFRSTETTSKNLGSITSNISGRFVAVMPNEGLPQIFLSCTAEVNNVNYLYAEYRIKVKALKADNTPISGQRIEVNFDEQTTLGLNPDVMVISLPEFVTAKEGCTNPEGEFTTTVRLDPLNYSSGKTFVFVINSGTQFSSIAISKP